MKMIKVDRDSLHMVKVSKSSSIDLVSNPNISKLEGTEHKKFTNFYTTDFLGIHKFLSNSKQNKIVDENGTEKDLGKALTSLDKIFDEIVFLWTDETNIHQIVLSEAITPNDFLIIDEYANTKIRIAADLLAKKGIGQEIIKHNNVEEIENVINKQKECNRNIWYLADSIYPVPGDIIPVLQVQKLLERYHQFFLYTDDSLGLSVIGEKGKGLICHNFPGLNKILNVSSLTKAFGAEAGAIAVTGIESIKDALPYNKFSRKKILQSIINSAGLHSSGEVKKLQEQLKEKINYYQELVRDCKLPLISNADLAVSYLVAGSPAICLEICSNLLKEGFYVSSVFFPHTPVNQSGIKINISVSHSKSEIKKLVDTLKEAYINSLKKRRLTFSDLR